MLIAIWWAQEVLLIFAGWIGPDELASLAVAFQVENLI